MIVKSNEKQVSFLFQEKDPYFEMGYMILDQAKLSGMLPYKRTKLNEKEKLIFQVAKYRPLAEILPTLTEDELIDILYATVFLTQKVEENGFMKRECIWMRYESIYFDETLRKPLWAVLPISQEFRYAGGISWLAYYEECLVKIAGFLPEEKRKRIEQLTELMKSGEISNTELLQEIDILGNGMSGMCAEQREETPDTRLELVYCGKDGTFSFTVEEDDFVIGRSREEADGVLQLSNAVSRRHCLITKINRNYFVQDMDSANCTYVNGTRIPPYELMQLEQNDVLSLANVDMRVNLL